MIVTPLFNQHIGTRRKRKRITVRNNRTPATSSHFALGVERGLEAKTALCGIFELECELKKSVR